MKTKRIISLLLAAALAVALLPTAALAESWVLEQPVVEQKPNRISLVELAIDALREGKTPPTTATVTKVDVTRGTAQVTVEKMEWSGGFDQNGRFQKNKEYKVVIGLRITGCSNPSDPPRFTAAMESANQTTATLRAGDFTTANIPSLQPTGDKQYIEFALDFTVKAVGDAPTPAGKVYANLKQSPYTFAGGSGTKADPYLISTPDQLNAVRQGLDKHYRLANDIDLSAWGNWMPIGGEGVDRLGNALPFTGSFDGAGHVVSGMTITGDPWDYACEGEPGKTTFSPKYFGLFAHVKGQEETVNPGDAYEDTTLNGISNLGMVNYTVAFSYENTAELNGPQFGAIAGRTDNTRIVSCWSSGGTVNGGEKGSAGGIVGNSYHTAIRECWNSSAITAGRVGGIVGYILSPTWISHCFNAGTLAAKGDAFGIGYGLPRSGGAGEKKEMIGIMYCYNSGAISGETATGVGFADFMDNVYNAGALNADDPKNNSPVAGYPGFSGATPPLGVSHSGERVLTDENWMDSPTLGRKVLVALREDLLTTASADVVKGVGGFTDVQATDYFANAVLWAVGRRITMGTGNNAFSPDNTCTKAEALTFIYRAEGEPPHDMIPDVTILDTFEKTNNGWFFEYYYRPSSWAYHQGMITPTTYLHDPCTRADFVTYLWQAAGSPKAQTTKQFTDVPAGAAYAQAVAWAVANGVTTGTGDGTTFSPNMICTRGQIVTFLHRAYLYK